MRHELRLELIPVMLTDGKEMELIWFRRIPISKSIQNKTKHLQFDQSIYQGMFGVHVLASECETRQGTRK